MAAMPVKTFHKLLNKVKFLHVATVSADGRPSAAPKLVLKVDGQHIYLVDCTIGWTWRNLKNDPRVSLSFVDDETLRGYQMNGLAEVLEGAAISDDLRKTLEDEEIALTVKRVMKGVQENKRHEDFEIGMSDKFTIFKITLLEIVEIGYKGTLTRSII
jgi:predicted pyridoxine 5'-phosphate oxidase superfamily flavin-nucleotide-binding protein